MTEIILLSLLFVVLPVGVGIGCAIYTKSARDTFDAETSIGDIDELHRNFKDEKIENEKQQKVASVKKIVTKNNSVKENKAKEIKQEHNDTDDMQMQM